MTPEEIVAALEAEVAAIQAELEAAQAADNNAATAAELVDLARGRAGWLQAALGDPEVADEERATKQRADTLWAASTFDRIAQAESLAANPQLFAIIEWMTVLARQSTHPAQPLAALQQFWQDKGANVHTKHALTRLVVNL